MENKSYFASFPLLIPIPPSFYYMYYQKSPNNDTIKSSRRRRDHGHPFYLPLRDPVEKSGNSPRPKKRRRLAAIALELKAAGLEGKRVGELRKLVKEAGTKGVPKSKSERAIRLLEALKQEKENNVKPKKAKKK